MNVGDVVTTPSGKVGTVLRFFRAHDPDEGMTPRVLVLVPVALTPTDYLRVRVAYAPEDLEETQYTTAVIVIAQPIDPCGCEASIYCMMADWPTTPAGREFDLKVRLAIAEKDADHSRAVAIDLRTDLATAHKRIAELEARPTLPSEHVCEECGKSFPTLPAVRMHAQRAHRGMQTTKRAKTEAEPPQPEAAPEPPQLPARPKLLPLPDDPAWRCARCDKGTQDGAFTRSLTRPELCLRCAGVASSSTEQSAIAA